MLDPNLYFLKKNLHGSQHFKKLKLNFLSFLFTKAILKVASGVF